MKKELRSKLKKIIVNNKEERSINIIKEIINLDCFKQSKNIGIYYPIFNEVDIKQILSFGLNKNFYIPKIINDNINYIKINNFNDNLVNSNLNILEPINNDIINKSLLELLIIPGIGFNRDNYRLGYGKGYYDKFLKDYKGFKIGVIFEEFIIDFNNEDHDIKLDLIIKG